MEVPLMGMKRVTPGGKIERQACDGAWRQRTGNAPQHDRKRERGQRWNADGNQLAPGPSAAPS